MMILIFSIEDRILNGTLRTKQQTNFSGIETNIKKQIKLAKSQHTKSSGHELISGTSKGPADINIQHELERDYSLGMPLGQTTIENDSPPSFRLLMLAGEIDNYEQTFEDPNLGTALRIPQLDVNITYDITAHKIDEEDQQSLRVAAAKRNKHVEFSQIFPDGTYLKFEGQHALVMLEELNVDSMLESFEVEVLEEVVETRRVTKLDQNGRSYTETIQTTGFKPIFFDPGNIETVGRPGDEYTEATEEDVTPHIEGSVGSIFNLNSDGQLSVPLGLLTSSLHSPGELSSALQNKDSTYLQKPMLNIPLLSMTNNFDAGPLYNLERDIYFTGESSGGDPEEC